MGVELAGKRLGIREFGHAVIVWPGRSWRAGGLLGQPISAGLHSTRYPSSVQTDGGAVRLGRDRK